MLERELTMIFEAVVVTLGFGVEGGVPVPPETPAVHSGWELGGTVLGVVACNELGVGACTSP